MVVGVTRWWCDSVADAQDNTKRPLLLCEREVGYSRDRLECELRKDVQDKWEGTEWGWANVQYVTGQVCRGGLGLLAASTTFAVPDIPRGLREGFVAGLRAVPLWDGGEGA